LSKPTICKAVQSLTDKGVIKKEVTGLFGKEEVYYSLIVNEEDDQLKDLTGGGKNSLPGGVKNFNPQNKQTKDKSLKRQQQASPVERPSAFVVVPSLRDLKESSVTDDEKKRLSATYPENVINDAIATVQQQGFQDNFLKSLRAACKGAWKPGKTAKTTTDGNRKFAKEIEEVLNPHLVSKAGYSYSVGTSYAELASTKSAWVLNLEFNEPDFRTRFETEINNRLKNCYFK